MSTELILFRDRLINTIENTHRDIKTKTKKYKKNNSQNKEENMMLIEDETNNVSYKIYQFNMSINDKILKCNEVETFILSYYNADGLLEMLKNINDITQTEELYIICVGYKNKFGGDVQIGFSGTEKRHINESPVEILQRECIEEIGNINCIDSVTHIGKPFECEKKIHTTIAVNLNDRTKLLKKINYNIVHNKKIIKKQQRVNGILYGNLKNTLHIVNLRGGNRPLNSRDNIDKLYVIPVKTAIDMVLSLRRAFEGNTNWYLDKKTLKWIKSC